MFTLALVLALTWLGSLILTRLIRHLACRIGFTDRPDKDRKLHRRPTALGGGVAIYVATLLALVALLIVEHPRQASLLAASREIFSLLVAGGVIVIVGLLDDRFQLRGRHKLLGQIAASTLLVSLGLTIERVQLFGHTLELGWLSSVVTVMWLVGTINAINLLDGIDGLASTIGAILTLAIGVMAAMYGNAAVSVVAMVFAASILGFLRYNFPPATIFLGDTGSMLIGLVVGALAIQGSLKGAGTLLFAAPLAVWTIPLFDSAAAIARRRLTGRSIYDADRAHLHHRLMRYFGSTRRVLAWVALSCSFTAAAAIVSVVFHSDSIALAGCAIAITALVATRLFGHVELKLLLARLADVMPSFLRGGPRHSSSLRLRAIRLQGHRRWELLWEALTQEAEKLGLLQVTLFLNLALIEEGFYANWQRDERNSRSRQWSLELPLFVGDKAVGRLHVTGLAGDTGALEEVDLLLAKLAPLEDMLADLATDAQRPFMPQTPSELVDLVSHPAPLAANSPIVIEVHERHPVGAAPTFAEVAATAETK